MIVTHVLALVVGALVALAVLGSALKTVVLPQEGFPRLSQFVFALVLPAPGASPGGTTAWRSSLRGLYAPVALVSLPLAWMILMMAAFTGIYWGTHDLSWSRAFEISVSSLTTMGFAEPNGTGPDLDRLRGGDDRAGPRRPAHQLPADHLLRLQRPREGHQPPAPDRRLAPQRHRVPPDASNAWAAWRAPTCGATRPTGCSTWSRRTPRSRSSPTSPSPTPSNRGSPPWGRCSTPSALVFAVSDRDDFGRCFADAQKGPLTVLVYGLPLIVRIAQAVNIPLPPPDAAPRPHGPRPASPPRRSASAGTSTKPPSRPCRASSPSRRAREEEAWRRFAWIRSAYDPALRALAGVTLAAPAPWTTDRPALVGKSSLPPAPRRCASTGRRTAAHSRWPARPLQVAEAA